MQVIFRAFFSQLFVAFKFSNVVDKTVNISIIFEKLVDTGQLLFIKYSLHNTCLLFGV